MVSDSSTTSGRAASRSPIVYALYGAAACLAVVAAVAFLLWPTAPGAGSADGPGDGAPGGGFGFGPSPVEVAIAVETMAAEPVSLVGEVAPVRQAVVAGEVEGRVSELLVDEGDRVRAGDVLLRLDTTTTELDLAASRANRAEAQARLVRFESEVRRITDLRERGAISEREFEQAIADRDAQTQAMTRIESEAAGLEELIARAEITAPFAGQISAVHAELGEWNSRGGDVVTLVDMSEVEVTVNAPERYVGQVEQARLDGIDVPVEFEAVPGLHYGKVKAVIPQANPQARTFPVIVLVPNPDGRIRAGMSARVLAQIGDPVPTVLVPKDALVLRSGYRFHKERSRDNARRVFRDSLWYLPTFLALLVLHSRHWGDAGASDDDRVRAAVAGAKKLGSDWCPHEISIFNNDEPPTLCPPMGDQKSLKRVAK